MIVNPLVGKQRRSFHLATARINVWEGAVRSSKTIGSLIRWIRFIRQAPPGPLLMVGKTERTLKRNVLDPLQAMLGKQRCRVNMGNGEAQILGRLVYLVGASNEAAPDKIKGLTLVGAYVDEVTTIPQSFWVMLLTRLSIPGAAVFGTTNPDGPQHWLMRDYLQRPRLHLDRDGVLHRGHVEDPLNLHRFSFQLADNPNLDPGYVEEIQREFTGLWRRRLILGEWCLAEGVVYESWNPSVHVVQQVPRITSWLACGIDYGTTAPFHALLLGLGVDGRLYVGHEWRWDSRARHGSLTDAEYSQRLRGWMDGLGIRPTYTVVDPSAASFRVQLFRDQWTSHAADNEVVDGIRTVSSLLATDRLRVHASCTGLIGEIPGYAWDEDASAKGEDKPIKLNDHGCDALRYAIKTTEAVWRPTLDLQLAA